MARAEIRSLTADMKVLIPRITKGYTTMTIQNSVKPDKTVI